MKATWEEAELGHDQMAVQQVSSAFFASALQHVGREIRAMNAAVRSLERPTRQRIQSSFPESEWWRGLADASFIQMADLLAIMATAPTTEHAGQPCFVLPEGWQDNGPSPIVRLIGKVA